MALIKKRSVAPFYATAGVFLYFAFFRDFYAISHYITALIVAFGAALLARAIWPNRVYDMPDPAPAPEAAAPDPAPQDPKIDALIRERNRAIGEMHRLNDAIEDAHISAQIEELELLTSKIIDHVVEQPHKQPQIRKFLNYYLPTTIKLLNAYDRMGSAGVSGENIDGTMQKIADMLDNIIQAFQRQLDGLFGNDAMDISADITVLETMLAREGLGDTKL